MCPALPEQLPDVAAGGGLPLPQALVGADGQAEMAQKQLPKLKGCGAHFTVVLSDVDENLYKRLGMHVSYEAKYERQRGKRAGVTPECFISSSSL